MNFEILSPALLAAFQAAAGPSPLAQVNAIDSSDIPAEYFQFYNSVASVYSSKIEGENIDYDSYYKHKFLHIKYLFDYTRKVDDLVRAYEFIAQNSLSLENIQQAHCILSANLLPKGQRGRIRTSNMFIVNSEQRIEYVAAAVSQVPTELNKLQADMRTLQQATLSDFEVFYYAAYLHLAFVKIHPSDDGNGRTARLLEKWFLLEKLGEKATAVPLEKNYYLKLPAYYTNLKKLGPEYETLDFSRALDFLLMTVLGLGVR